jgi:hypothetical protein
MRVGRLSPQGSHGISRAPQPRAAIPRNVVGKRRVRDLGLADKNNLRLSGPFFPLLSGTSGGTADLGLLAELVVICTSSCRERVLWWGRSILRPWIK